VRERGVRVPVSEPRVSFEPVNVKNGKCDDEMVYSGNDALMDTPPFEEPAVSR
jgi:hypothetical protein